MRENGTTSAAARFRVARRAPIGLAGPSGMNLRKLAATPNAAKRGPVLDTKPDSKNA